MLSPGSRRADGDQSSRLARRFDPAQVEICYLNWSGPDRRANLELWSPSARLEPGESITLAHAYEIA